jgi:hypothetical protein
VSTPNRVGGHRGGGPPPRLILFFLGPLVVLVTGLAAPVFLAAQPLRSSHGFVVGGDIGYDASKLVWNVGEGGGRRGSQLAYRGLSIASARIHATARFLDRGSQQWLLWLRAEAGSILGGTIRDSDGDPGHIGVLSVSEATGKSTASASVALGWYQTLPGLPPLNGLALWLGFDWSKRIIRMQNGEQILPRAVPGDILDGLDSRYRARWMGPWAAAEPTLSLGRAQLTGRLAFHFLNRFRAQGRWNLRQELAQPRSFVQESKGMGLEAGFGVRFPISPTVAVSLRADRSRFTALWGDDTYYRVDGSEGTLELRSVALTSNRVHLGISWGY